MLAVEVDRDLAAALEARALPGLQVVTGDFLRQDWDALRRRLARVPIAPDRSGSSAIFPTTSRRRSCSGCSSWPGPARRFATPP